jgi:uncharacterized protein (DUF362 family)
MNVLAAVGENLESYYQNLTVAIWRGRAGYSQEPPYHPCPGYPEYRLGIVGSEPNPAYAGVRACLRLLGLDQARYGTPDWNPLRGMIVPGHTVVIKPNFVLSSHREGGNLFAVITHPSILRAIVDYVYKALGGVGRIIIADAPQMDCNFQELLGSTQLASIQELYWSQYRFDVDILDLRGFWLDWQCGDEAAYARRRIRLPSDPQGSVLVGVGEKSAFYGIGREDRFYGADYDRQTTIAHHHGDVHEYMVSRTVLTADVFISVPKLKVHKKVGVTLNAKGLVGITTDKNYLVHYTLGTPDEGGDQFPAGALSFKETFIVKGQRFLSDSILAKHSRVLDRIYDYAVAIYRASVKPWLKGIPAEKRVLDGGNWYGNDSAWRMVVDLMRIIIFADQQGHLLQVPQRKVFSVVDGIVGGENNGPLTPDAREVGVIMAGFNPLAVDIVGTRLMGFDWRKLKWIQRLLDDGFYVSVDGIRTVSEQPELSALLSSGSRYLDFVPHPGWRGHIEV